MSLSGDVSSALAVLGHVYAVAGKAAEARKVLAELSLKKAYEGRSQRLTWIKVDPQLDSLRGEPRFQDLLRRMNLAP